MRKFFELLFCQTIAKKMSKRPRKKVYQFHHDMVAKHEAELQKTGQTKFLSTFLFRLFSPTERDTVERVLSESGKQFQWTGNQRQHPMYDNPVYVVRLIDAGRIDAAEALDFFDTEVTYAKHVYAYPDDGRQYGKEGSYTITRQDVINLFDRTFDYKERLALAFLMSARCATKFSVLNYFPVRKLNYIVRRSIGEANPQ